MNTWDRHLFRLYAFAFLWICISVYAIFLCSDFLFKHQRFLEHKEWIFEYYSLRTVPFFIISMPVVAFLTLILVAHQLRKRHEWHIVKLVCASNGRIAKALFASGGLLCLSWIFLREGVLPAINERLEASARNIKGRGEKSQMLFSQGANVAHVRPETDDLHAIRVHLIETRADGGHVVTNPGLLHWNHEFKLWEGRNEALFDSKLLNHLVPSPQVMSIRNQDYVASSLRELLLLYADHPVDRLVSTAIAERFVQPVLFILYFLLAAYDVLRCRHDRLIWFFPTAGLMMFSFSIMLFKPMGVEIGPLPCVAIVALIWLGTQRCFSLYFRRHGRSN